MENLKFVFVFCCFCLINCSDDSKNEDLFNDYEIETRLDKIKDFDFSTPCRARSFTYFIEEDCFDTEVESVIPDAISEYNNLSTAINFTTSSSKEGADIVFECFDSALHRCGYGLTQWNYSQPLSYDNANTQDAIISLNTDTRKCDCETPEELQCLLKRTIMRQIGHALGILRDCCDYGYGEHIEGTTVFYDDDPNSIFYGKSECDKTCEFTEGDILALETLYPEPGCGECIPRLTISGATFLCNLGEEATYCIPDQFTLDEWTLPNNLTEISRDGNCITVNLNSIYGDNPIIASINDNGCIYQYELEVGYGTPLIEIIGDNEMCIGDMDVAYAKVDGSYSGFTVLGWTVYGSVQAMNNTGAGQAYITTDDGPGGVCAEISTVCGISYKCLDIWVEDCNNGGGWGN